ncbi:hypothetical protein [Nocardia uniformis]|uniref:hypothetical protein n=1 Tax=Nocardia uniformis TaxID=53432 RepID=UPI000AE584DC|nr:hypothetical protein [Nocardia uniformis]
MSDSDKTSEAKPSETPVTLEKTTSAPAEQPGNTMPASGIRRLQYLTGVAAAVLGVLAIALGVAWQNSTNDLEALRSGNADREHAAAVASDYTLRSLTYDHKNLPAFFDGVQRGTSEGLSNRYTEVRDTLTTIMTEAQVVATGNVLGTSVEAIGNDQFVVTVFATQRTQNIQQQDPGTVPNLLVVTVAKNGGDWQVVDYGPKDAAVKDGTAK